MGALRDARAKAPDAGQADSVIPDLPPMASDGAFIADLIAEAPQAPPAADEADAAASPAVQPPASPEAYLAAFDGLIRRLDPSSDQSSVLASTDAQDAWQQLRGMTAGAVALGLREQITQVFARYGRPGQGLLTAALADGPLAQAVAQFKPGAASASSPAATPQEARRQPSAGGSGGIGDALAKLIAAPVTLPVAAGSRIWQFLTQRFGPRPAIPATADAMAIVKNQFDDACNRAIDKISHIRSGPMNPELSEMIANPLKLDEQFQRMAADGQGEFHERGERLKQALAQPEVQQQYAQLHEALEQVHYRGRRLAEAGHDAGEPVDELIAARVDELARSSEGLPAVDQEGKLKHFHDMLQDLLERLREFLRALFSKHAPAV